MSLGWLDFPLTVVPGRVREHHEPHRRPRRPCRRHRRHRLLQLAVPRVAARQRHHGPGVPGGYRRVPGVSPLQLLPGISVHGRLRQPSAGTYGRVISVSGVVRAQGFVVMLVPLVIAGVPVLDTMSAVVRRLRNHERIDHADFGHIHHRLMRAGLSQKRSVALLWLCSACLAVAGCSSAVSRARANRHHRAAGRCVVRDHLALRPVQAGAEAPLRQ